MMPEHVNAFTLLLNKWFGAWALALLHLLHITPDNPATPIPNDVGISLAVVLVAVLFFLWLRPRISAEKPGATQQVMEMLLTNPMKVGIFDLLEDNAGHDWERYAPFVGSVAIFILFANSAGVFPRLDSPTAHKTVPLACAILIFLYYNIQGLRALGPVGYAKTFSGPVWWLSWLIFPVEILSNLARLLSLTVRLWANILASELIYFVFLILFLAPVAHFQNSLPAASYGFGIFTATVPVLFQGLHLFVAIVQAFVFTILPAIYLGLATSHDH